ncbi:MAG: BamA/TamA family outer membrane protein [Burkholderiales bacterium]|nr:BamA/TamA family outer membrane protein [Burkholderiales bacterium]
MIDLQLLRRLSLGSLLLLSAVFSSSILADDEKLPRFDILEFQVDGNTVLEAAAIERAVTPFLGEARTIDEVDEARLALEQAYQKAGFLTVIVNVPEQKVEHGVVRLEVIEATVEHFAVSGNRYYSRGYIRSRLPAIEEGEVPNFVEVQKQIAKFNQTPGRSVVPVLKAGRAPGTVEIETKVSDQFPLHGSIEINNRQTLNTEPLRLSGNLRYDNLWGRDHSFSFLFLTSPEDRSQVQVYSANYLFRLPDSNTIFAFYAVRSRSDIAVIGGTNVLGDANIFGARAILPLRPAGEITHSIVLGADYKDFLENLRVGAGQAVRTPIDYVALSTAYQFNQQGRRGSTRGNVSLNFAPRGPLFGNEDAEFNQRRFGASANYMIGRAEVSRLQNLPHGFGVYTKAGGQITSEPVVNTEQFFAGGVDTVRGYFEAEVLGDTAAYLSVEGRSPALLSGMSNPVGELVAVAFADAATVRVKQAPPQQIAKYQLWSFGLGLRLKTPQNLSASVDVGVPMADAVETKARDPRLHFKLAYDF